MTDPKNLVIYAPLTFSTISSKVFRSFLEMSREPIPGFKTDIFICDKFPMDYNRNYAFDLTLTSKYDADFVMCCDLDQVFKKDTIVKLMQTLEDAPDAGGVTGIYFRKTPPHRCVVGKYSPWSTDLEMKRKSLESEGFVGKDGKQTLYYKPLLYFDVVQQVDVFGLGCVLFRSDTLRKIKQPFCRYVNRFSTDDATFLGHSEDMWMCSQLKQAGVKMLCNPKVQVGHVVEKVIMGNEAEN